MDKTGRQQILEVVGSEIDEHFEVLPVPEQGQDLQFVDIEFQGRKSPAYILNALGRAGLIGETAPDTGPSLKLIGQIKTVNPMGYSSQTLSFEDQNHKPTKP